MDEGPNRMTDHPTREAVEACPHCGASGYFVWNSTQSRGAVKCTQPNCGAQGGSFERERTALLAWNARLRPVNPNETPSDTATLIGHLDMACQLIQEAKGAGGDEVYVINHLDDAEHWIDKAAAMLRALTPLATPEPACSTCGCTNNAFLCSDSFHLGWGNTPEPAGNMVEAWIAELEEEAFFPDQRDGWVLNANGLVGRALAKQRLAYLRAAHPHLSDAAKQAGGGWQPIETAPRDGTWVLTWSAKCGHGLARYYAWPTHDPIAYGDDPTHWQPLPAAPNVEQAGGEA